MLSNILHCSCTISQLIHKLQKTNINLLWRFGEYCGFEIKIQRKNKSNTGPKLNLKENRREEWQHLQPTNEVHVAWRMTDVFKFLNMNYYFATLQKTSYFVIVSNTIFTTLNWVNQKLQHNLKFSNIFWKNVRHVVHRKTLILKVFPMYFKWSFSLVPSLWS